MAFKQIKHIQDLIYSDSNHVVAMFRLKEITATEKRSDIDISKLKNEEIKPVNG